MIFFRIRKKKRKLGKKKRNPQKNQQYSSESEQNEVLKKNPLRSFIFLFEQIPRFLLAAFTLLLSYTEKEHINELQPEEKLNDRKRDRLDISFSHT